MSYCCKDKFKLQEVGDSFQLLQGGSVTSVNGKVGAVVLTAEDVGALPDTYEAPVTSVNSQTGDVVLDAGDIAYESTTVEDELGTINSALSSLQSVTEIIDTASGAIASFPDGSGLPMRSLLAQIEPVQDLHGQDAPYPAGSGANQFPYTVADEFTENGVTFKSDGQGKYTITGTCTGSTSKTFSFPSEIVIPDGANYKFCFMNSQALDSNNFLSFMNGSTTVDSWTVGVVNKESTYSGMSNKACTGIKFSVYSGMTYNMTLTPMFVPKASTVTGYIPFANICPISGWTGLSGQRTGANLGEFTHGKGIDTGGHIHDFATRSATVTPIKIDSARQYKYVNSNSSNAGIYAVWNGETLVRRVAGMTSGTVMDTSGGDSLYVCGYSGDADVLPETCGVFFADQFEEFEPYTGETITVSWQTEAGTVYDGYIDVVSGELVATHGVDTYDGSSDESWTIIPADNRAYISVPSIKTPATNSSLAGLLSNEYKEKTYDNIALNKPGITARANITQINVFDTRITSDAVWRTFLASNPLQVVYPLAEPIHYTLTPQQILTLIGNNTVFVDTGSVSVTYQASIKGYIDKVLGA